jgi:ABC-type uncharacterized transport system permease subunit
MTILGYSSFDWLPSALYLLLLITLSVRPRNRPETKSFIFLVQGLIFLILLVHGAVLHDSIFTPAGFVFGFAQNLSLIAWVGLAFYWFQSWMLADLQHAPHGPCLGNGVRSPARYFSGYLALG